MISISIVSHGQAVLVDQLLQDLESFAGKLVFNVVVTKNIPENSSNDWEKRYSYPLKVIENAHPKGFGANHNAAFEKVEGDYFCVMNPDIRLGSNPFPALLSAMRERAAALIAPAVLSPTGHLEDSIRHFPTVMSLLRKSLGIREKEYRYSPGVHAFPVDWVAGMFMLFRSEAFQEVAGFDERFFLYYEDVDVCARLWKAEGVVLACPQAQVIHDARRASRHQPRYMLWHASSLLRYFGRYWFRLPIPAGR